MPAADPFLLSFSIAIACVALAALRPIVAARRETRSEARRARERSRRLQAEIEALRKARQDA